MLSNLKRKLIAFAKERITRRGLIECLRGIRLDGLVLDVGASGPFTRPLYEKAIRLNIARADVDCMGDALRLPFAGEAFDGAVMIETLEHLTEPARAIEELRRVLKPGAPVVVSTRFCYPIHDAPGDYFRFTRHGLEKLFEGWDIDRVEPLDLPVETLSILCLRLAFDRAIPRVFRAVFFLATLVAWPLNRLIARVARGETLTSGYLVVARRPREQPS